MKISAIKVNKNANEGNLFFFFSLVNVSPCPFLSRLLSTIFFFLKAFNNLGLHSKDKKQPNICHFFANNTVIYDNCVHCIFIKSPTLIGEKEGLKFISRL